MSEQHKFIDGCKHKCGACNLCCLAVCEKCWLYEGALTTHCPGKPVPFFMEERVYKGQLNFRGGIWIRESSEHTPAFPYFQALGRRLEKRRGRMEAKRKAAAAAEMACLI